MGYKNPKDPRILEKARIRAREYRLRHPELETKRWARNSEHIKEVKKLWRIRSRQKRIEIERGWKIQALHMVGRGRTECTDCHNSDVRVIQIHHLNGKNGNKKDKGINLCYDVTHAKRGIDDLILLCANCHLIRHAITQSS